MENKGKLILIDKETLIRDPRYSASGIIGFHFDYTENGTNRFLFI